MGPYFIISHLSFQRSLKPDVGRDKIQLLSVSHFIGAHPQISRANITKHKTAGIETDPIKAMQKDQEKVHLCQFKM